MYSFFSIGEVGGFGLGLGSVGLSFFPSWVIEVLIQAGLGVGWDLGCCRFRDGWFLCFRGWDEKG